MIARGPLTADRAAARVVPGGTVEPKGLVLVLAVCLTTGLWLGAPQVDAGQARPRDVNCSDEVDSVDAAVVLQYVARLIADLPCSDNAELNGDGTTTAVEAALILQYNAGLIDRLGPPTTGALAAAAGGEHTCALTTDGGVKCWGRNRFGQLGDGTRIDRLTPVDVSGLSSGVIAVAAGADHACALRATGAVGCWGDNDRGELGDGTATERSYPVAVVGLESGVSSISTRDEHTCAVTRDGTVKCWGTNWSGQLGDGTTGVGNESATPVDVIGLSGPVAAVAAGGSHTCALLTTGTVQCWGSNSSGQLGDGTTAARERPVDVVGLVDVAAIAAGGGHICALTTSGSVHCWGSNYSGALGAPAEETCGELDGMELLCSSRPVDVVGLGSGVAAIATGGAHTCAVSIAGGLKCWGSNTYGQIGDGTGWLGLRRAEPTQVDGLTSGVASVAPGGGHTCAVSLTGALKCWGYNWVGQLGDGTDDQRLSPVDVIGFGDDAAASLYGRRGVW
jgi:alpha-tubulin suppressor-like RCC1 family protein